MTVSESYINIDGMKPRNEKNGPALIFIVTPTREMMPIFSIETLARQAVLQLERAANDANAGIYGYALLPSCLNMLIGFRGTYDLAGFMYNYKWLSSQAMVALDHGEFHDQLFRKGKFKPWMNRFDNLAISSKEQFETKLNYLHYEPVHKGLITDPIDWEFSSARDWMRNERGLIKVEKDLTIFRSIWQ